MKLQILIPHYKEPISTIKPLLDSIEIQQNINRNDFSILIMNDGKDNLLPAEFLRQYTFDLEYKSIPHCGVASTRNKLIETAEADYVMFCDCDDMFLDVRGLDIITTTVEQIPSDIYIFAFYEEVKDQNNQLTYVLHDEDTHPFIHAKVFRRKFLIENNIQFYPNLQFNEDVVFSYLAQSLTTNTIFINCPIYLWKWNQNSTTRQMADWPHCTAVQRLDALDQLITELHERKLFSVRDYFLLLTTYETYYNMCETSWNDPNIQKKYGKAVRQRFKQFWQEWGLIYDSASNEQKQSLMGASKRKSLDKAGIIFEPITFNDWLNDITK